MNWFPCEELLPELQDIIFALARATSVTTRARLRRVCKQLCARDQAFVSPDWTASHPDIRHLGMIPRRMFNAFCTNVAEEGLWDHITTPPSSIQWCFKYGDYPKHWSWSARDRDRRLRLAWPDHRPGELAMYNVLSIELYSDGSGHHHYTQGSTSPEECNEYMGSGSGNVKWCLPQYISLQR